MSSSCTVNHNHSKIAAPHFFTSLHIMFDTLSRDISTVANVSARDACFHKDIHERVYSSHVQTAFSKNIEMHCILRKGLIVFSNLSSASVLRPSLVPVFLTCIGSKFAISTRIFLVFSSIQEVSDPIIPARAHIFSSSAITMSSSVSRCSFSNRSTKRSPSFACLTVIPHAILSASKKWIGCPVVYIHTLE